MIRWMERQGYDVTYCTSIDTHRPWPDQKSIKAFLSVGHDEYWSELMRANVTFARSNGVNLAFLAANVCYYKIHFESEERVFSVNKATDRWRGSEGNNSRDYPAEIELIGVEYVYNTVYPPNDDLTLRNPTDGHWVFESTGLQPGSSLTLDGLLGYEVDGCWIGDPCTSINSPSPSPETAILADSAFQPCPGLGFVHSYMTMYTASSGSQVFATGSMQWNWGVDGYGFGPGFPADLPLWVHPVAQQITHNALRTFAGQDRARVLFLNTDAVTAGDWLSAYGADGYLIADMPSAISQLPSYVSAILIEDQDTVVWEDPSGDPRALLKPGSSERIASAWTTTDSQNSGFTIDVSFTDTDKHLVTLYCADWIGSGSILQQIDVFDYSDPAHALDTRTLQLPSNGTYLTWELSGHQIIRITKPDASIGNKAMVSAVFFGGGN